MAKLRDLVTVETPKVSSSYAKWRPLSPQTKVGGASDWEKVGSEGGLTQTKDE